MLIGNYTVLNKNPTRFLGGSTTSVETNTRASSGKNGMVRGRFYRADGTVSLPLLTTPTGTYPSYCFILPQKAGQISSHYMVNGVTTTAANLAGGRNGEAVVTGSGTSDSSVIAALGNITGSVTGSGVSSATLTALAYTTGAFIGAGDVNGTVTSIALLNAALDGFTVTSGTAEGLIGFEINAALVGEAVTAGALAGALTAAASVVGFTGLTGGITGLRDASANLVGQAEISADVIGAWFAAGDLLAAGNLVGAANALSHISSLVIGQTVLAGTPLAAGRIGSVISSDVSGELTASGIVQALMAHEIESGYSFETVMQLIAAIQAGKTSIVDHGDGTATVTFRNLPDTEDQAVFELDGSERVSRADL